MNPKILILLFAGITLLASCSNDKKSDRETPAADTIQLSPNAALAALEARVKQNPDNPELLHQLALLYIDNKRYQDALYKMQVVMSIDSTKAPYFLTMADLSFAANRTYDAKQNLEKAISLDPENMDAMMRLAELNLIVKQYAASVDLLNKVIKTDPKNTTAWFMRGLNFKENGDTNRAVQDFQSAIEADPEFYNAYMQLGMIFQLKDDPASEGYFNNAIRIRPNSEEAIYGRGLWYQDHGQLDKAIQDYTSIIQLNPTYKSAHFNLGYIHQIYLKVYAEAIKHYTNAIQADPKYAEAFYNRGLCYETVGNITDAASDYKAALMIRSVYPPAEEGLKRVTR